MTKIYIDSETCGLHSMMVLLQYAEEDGPVRLHDVWQRPIHETLDIIEWFCENTVVGFNLAFDWFHCAKLYTIFRLADPDWIPEEHIHELAMLEPKGQDGPCIKPASALDLLLHSRKGPYQSLMAREDIRIKKVPTALAYALAAELEQRVELDGIYFAKSANKDAPHWKVYDRKDRDGQLDEAFKDVVLKFNPAGGLKFLAEYAMGFKPKYHYKDVEPDPKWRPQELGYAPTALAISSPEKNWEVWKDDKLVGYAWPAVIQHFIDHWAHNNAARDYARDDVVYTRALDEHFGYPEPGDDDSILACMVPVVRWHGFKIDIEGMKALKAKAQRIVDASPINVNKPKEVRSYVTAAMDDMEKLILEESTKKANLEAVEAWEVEEEEPCTKCDGAGCLRCDNTGTIKPGKHPAAVRAREILDVKIAAKEVELYDKLILAGRFHASFVVVGTKSSRMSGGDGLNAQGIKHTDEVRSVFPLAWEGSVLNLGDLTSCEVTIADACYNDANLRRDLVSGKKIPALFAMSLFPGKTYDQIIASKGTEQDLYSKGKQGVFAMIYGGDHNTLRQNLGIPEEVAKAAFDRFGKSYPGVEKARRKTFEAFCSMKQPAGTGSQVIWEEPAEYVESFLGFRRYYTLENRICRALFDLARKPPEGWRNHPVKVVRRDRIQTAGGAVVSALYGAAFAIQAANMRSAANHEIQSPGAQITKAIQRSIWDLQPPGVHELVIAPANAHDEVLVVSHPDYAPAIAEKVTSTIESFRKHVPLLSMVWASHASSWADKGTGEIHIGPLED